MKLLIDYKKLCDLTKLIKIGFEFLSNENINIKNKESI